MGLCWVWLGCQAGEPPEQKPPQDTGAMVSETVVEEGCAVWTLCCERQCTTEAEHQAWLAEPWDCDVECDTGGLADPPGVCQRQGEDTCAWLK